MNRGQAAESDGPEHRIGGKVDHARLAAAVFNSRQAGEIKPFEEWIGGHVELSRDGGDQFEVD